MMQMKVKWSFWGVCVFPFSTLLWWCCFDGVSFRCCLFLGRCCFLLSRSLSLVGGVVFFSSSAAPKMFNCLGLVSFESGFEHFFDVMAPAVVQNEFVCQKFQSFVKKSGAAAMVRQIVSFLDIATAICSRSNCALRFVNQHRVHSLHERPLSDGQLAHSWSDCGRAAYRLQRPVHVSHS